MALRSLLAKDWVLEVNTGTEGAPVWTPVRGLTSMEFALDNETEDDADFESDGWASEVITQRSWTLECEGRRKRDTSSAGFVPDAGQEYLRQAGLVVGLGASVHVRWYRRDGAPDAFEGIAGVQYSGGGGETTDLEPFEVELLGQGKPEPIDNPAAP
ncbi:phage tail tube protein [Spongiactinospora sp. TRM90649]|uniref:phage tail tube protein n=1 Tax=Spongiactinospora sp. TRM90649 TaxID=3031114 RepID=UPI0023F98FE4|nr:phage tail tube protein [Spongiactinospora sp. TRM90649]MDF5756660.1 phage tail tube protein [Spongiactinospora sp. TRM90649]